MARKLAIQWETKERIIIRHLQDDDDDDDDDRYREQGELQE